MRFSAPVGLAKFFYNTGFIELESLLSEEEINVLSGSIDKTLSLRLGMTVENVLKLSAADLYKAGHDVCRVDPTIKKITWSQHLAEIVYEVTNEKPLRFAYDQAIRVGNVPSKCLSLFKEETTLNTISGL